MNIKDTQQWPSPYPLECIFSRIDRDSTAMQATISDDILNITNKPKENEWQLEQKESQWWLNHSTCLLLCSCFSATKRPICFRMFVPKPQHMTNI